MCANGNDRRASEDLGAAGCTVSDGAADCEPHPVEGAKNIQASTNDDLGQREDVTRGWCSCKGRMRRLVYTVPIGIALTTPHRPCNSRVGHNSKHNWKKPGTSFLFKYCNRPSPITSLVCLPLKSVDKRFVNFALVRRVTATNPSASHTSTTCLPRACLNPALSASQATSSQPFLLGSASTQSSALTMP